MTYLATTDTESLFSLESDKESSLFQPHSDDDDTSSILKHYSDTDSNPLNPPKAIFFNTSIPVSFQKHCIQLQTDDDSFRTILKEDPLVSIESIIQTLQRKFGFSDIIIILQDDVNCIKKVLYKDDRVIKIQNSLFRSMWVEEEDLPTATLKYTHSFKFLIHKI